MWFKELRHIASDDEIFLSWVTAHDKSWIYSYDPQTKQHSFQWKMNSLRPKMTRQVTRIVKSMHVIFQYFGQDS